MHLCSSVIKNGGDCLPGYLSRYILYISNFLLLQLPCVICRCFRGFRCGRGSYCCDCEDCFSSATTANQLRVFVRVRIDFVRFERRVELDVVEGAEDVEEEEDEEEDEEDDDDKAD